ncbi:hypothetical protein HNR19_000726 [Nocardioides thalensis]|uniref:FlgD Ig-like domain-containing protein n=1 Tax=Nocardioides thalensis TaxID=1914755 RepID=A0A853C091_9ACTN|nr:hypothetical protein [Nocardioides thalensis]NYJ00028.1 hypothetical protein [Nocardioides thalensis]
MKIRLTRLAPIAVALASLVLGVLAYVAPPASAEGEVTVTWPEITAFNPDTTEYIVNMQWDSGAMFLQLNGEYPERVPAPGDHLVDFPGSMVNDHVELYAYWCPTEVVDANSCQLVSATVVSVWNKLDLRMDARSRLGPSSQLSFLATDPILFPRTTADVHWEIRDGAVVVAEATHEDLMKDYYFDLPAIGSQPALEDGHSYQLALSARIDHPSFGELVGELGPRTFTWDESIHADLTTQVKEGDNWVAGDTFFPAMDSYLDSIRLVPVSSHEELRIVDATVRDATGEVVDALFTAGDEWRGVTSDWVVVPAGVYTIEAVVRDLAGNQAVATSQITIDDARVVEKVWRRSFAPADTIVRREVENCGRLRRPARAAWPGSMGLDTMACPDGRWSQVTVFHRVALPDSFYDERGLLRLSVVGAAARTRPRSGLRVSHEGDDFRAGSEYGTYRGAWRWGGGFPREGAIFEWTAMVEGRARYDIRKFIVESTYHVLE